MLVRITDCRIRRNRPPQEADNYGFIYVLIVYFMFAGLFIYARLKMENQRFEMNKMRGHYH